MSWVQFLLIVQFLVELVIFHYVGKYYIKRTERSTQLSEQIAKLSVKMASFIFLKAIYILVFIVQVMFILSGQV
ncbi:hypothetical protein DDR33_21795 [Pararcticibacter amylolyticus]|uniref:Uncharacterized protein n=2 Tax=Pararcticibacter amylolyticus TaxID=2173175 RepID=A0A2U2PAY7_9SPHI|nr:hypothetical protein DDR33_21795 [Pararcticibacter amylolyticus]